MDALIITKFGILLLIHFGLIFGLSSIASYYQEPLFLFKRFNINVYKLPLVVNFLIGSIVIALSVLALIQSKISFFILNAAFLSIWFLELGVISGKHFFHHYWEMIYQKKFVSLLALFWLLMVAILL